MLTVISYSYGSGAWLCQCDCGNTVYKKGYYLTHKQATTCREHKNLNRAKSNRFI